MHFMIGKKPGWYAGHYVSDPKSLETGGNVFLPNSDGYYGDGDEKPLEFVPDLPVAFVYYWTGKEVLNVAQRPSVRE